ncbi:MAG TPA: hypothetical protein VEQ58_07750 [Polyangiaceae bacterium]|nr:hypothetical protein [Polyangiaceae bacterium]
MKLGSVGLLLALWLPACDHDPGPMKVPTNQDVPLPPATALSAPPPPAAPPSAAPPAGKRPPCINDQSCNDDESVSALWGKCTPLGTCECAPGFELNPRGRCQKPVK